MTQETNYCPLIVNVPSELNDLLRRVQASPQVLEHRAMFHRLSLLAERGNTDESETNWRAVQYKAAQTFLAQAGFVIDEAVQGGMDSSNCTPMMYLVLALSLASGGCEIIDLDREEI